MATQRHLSRAPIREALIDIQVSPPVPIGALAGLKEKFAHKFPECKNIWQASVGLEIAPDGNGATTTEKSLVGYRFEAPGIPSVLQCRTNGFTFSRLSPYETWEQMRDEAQAMWFQFVSEAHPTAVSRLAVRYINALRIALPLDTFATYLAVPPELPAVLPQTLAGFLQRFVISRPNDNCTAIVTQALEESNPKVTPDGVTVFLDIDVFKSLELPPDSPEIWDTLQMLRKFKNDIFFEYLTEKSVELYI